MDPAGCKYLGMPTKAYSYLRFSTPEQMKGDSMRRQTSLAVEYCQRHGLVLDDTLTYQDLGVSAFRGKNAEAGKLSEFLEAVHAGLVPQGSYLLVESLDRISRQAAWKAQSILQSIVLAGVTVVTLADSKVYDEKSFNEDPMSLIYSILVFMRANEESVTKSRRVKAAFQGKRLKAAEGKAFTKKGPHWLKLQPDGTWAIIPEKADVVRRAFHMAAKGIGCFGIARKFNVENVPTPTEHSVGWHPATVSKMLSSPAAVGTFVPHVFETVDGKTKRVPQEPIKGYWPAIISEELFQQVQSQSAPRAHRGNPGALHNIFSGLAVCGLCGGNLHLAAKNYSRKSGPSRYLVCVRAKNGAGCLYMSMRYRDIEERFLLDESVLVLAPKEDSGDLERLEQLTSAISQVNEERQAASDGYLRTRDELLLQRLMDLKADLARLKAEEKALRDHIESTSEGMVERRLSKLRGLLRSPPIDRGAVNALLRSLLTGVSFNPKRGEATFNWVHGGQSKLQFGWPQEPTEAQVKRGNGQAILGPGGKTLAEGAEGIPYWKTRRSA